MSVGDRQGGANHDSPVLWRCRGCGQGLGRVVGRQLALSVVVKVDAGVRVQCRVCGLWQGWYEEQGGKVAGGKVAGDQGDGVPLRTLG